MEEKEMTGLEKLVKECSNGGGKGRLSDEFGRQYCSLSKGRTGVNCKYLNQSRKAWIGVKGGKSGEYFGCTY